MYKLFTILIITVTLLSCSSEDSPYSYLSDPKVEAEVVEFRYIASTDTLIFKQTFQAQEMYIVWGDQTPPEEFVFGGRKDSVDNIKPITHIFVEKGDYHVRIKASQLKRIILDSANKNQITEVKLMKTSELIQFTCDSQNIVELDFSECPKIERLVLFNNLWLESVALNKIFDSLPNVTGTNLESENNSEKYVIVLNGNKGDRHCDRSIAVSKGWIFKDSL